MLSLIKFGVGTAAVLLTAFSACLWATDTGIHNC